MCRIVYTIPCPCTLHSAYIDKTLMMLYSIFHRFIILVLIFCHWTRKFCSLACAKIELNENRKTSAELPLLCCRCLVYRNTNVQFVYLFVLSPATQNRFQCIHIDSSSVYFAMWPLLFHVYLHSCVLFSYSIFRHFFGFSPLLFFGDVHLFYFAECIETNDDCIYVSLVYINH